MGVHGTLDLAGSVAIDHQRGVERAPVSLGTCSVLRMQGMLIVPRRHQPLVGTSALSPVHQSVQLHSDFGQSLFPSWFVTWPWFLNI